MKKQLFLSVMLLTAAAEMFARIGGAGTGGGAPRRQPSQQPKPAPTNGGGSGKTQPQTPQGAVQAYPNNTEDLLAGALKPLGYSLQGYTKPTGGTALNAYETGEGLVNG